VNGPTPPAGAINVKAGYATPVAPLGGGGATGLSVNWEAAVPPPQLARRKATANPTSTRMAVNLIISLSQE
jgi:hypothetical protein